MLHNQKDILRRNHVALVDEVDPNDVFDQLQQDGVLTESDHELINTGTTRRERCQKLLGILPTRGPIAYSSFKNALKQSYSHLDILLLDGTGSTRNTYECVDSCTNISSSSTTKEIHYRICLKCQPCIPSYIADPSLRRAIHQNCCLIFENVEANDLLDLLYQESILEGNDCECIKSEKTRRNRCITLIRELSKCLDNNVFVLFIESLRRKYGYIANKLVETNQEDSERRDHSGESVSINEGCSYPILREVIRRGLRVNKAVQSTSTLPIPKVDTYFLTNVIEKGCYNIDKLGSMATSHFDDSNTVDDRCCQATNSHTNYYVPSKDRDLGQMLSDTSKEDNICRTQVTRNKHKRPETGIPPPKLTEYKPFHTTNCRSLTQLYDSHSKGQDIVFNSLSTLINQGQYEQFESCAVNIRQRQGKASDVMCILDYLFASRFLHAADVKTANRYIKSGLQLAQKTNNPKYFTLELLTSQTRMFSIKKKYEKLQRTLDDAKMIIEADPTCCTGRAAGWLYMNDVKHIMVQISMLNANRSNYPSVYEHLHKQAKESCQKSLDHFKREKGNDGPFGFGFALCRLIILLLRCGDRGLYKISVPPSCEEIELTGRYLHQLEDSDIPITTFLKVPFLLAKSDYQYRRNNLLRALEYAEEAFVLITNKNILEFREQAQNRVRLLRTKIDAEMQYRE
ncbi:uncharacterized protein LOC110456944 isoform X2 [Mizuhopecten yessoensis]|uniref:CARD domain-containing protein n=2 Tax=Mizuhopecten yessoensis TaxID=6573 RepID=A0A210Q9Y4_MIZYE|nr:uncharacterized protein LOC110456944 isoform X2 [Mizuhopecten yessoensis]OWF45509.1 hypothetical protein KP79_PYT10279 [Mizuhopecten yessoensis]